jgi:hypothetical protein
MLESNHCTELTMNWLYVPEMAYGKERRATIMHLFDTTEDAAYCVNTKYRPQMKDDPDLRKLVKQGKLKILRGGMPTSRRTYLVKA